MKDSILDFIGLVVIFILVVGGIIGALFAFVMLIVIPLNLAEKADCNDYGHLTNRQTKYDFWPLGQCYVKTDNGWFTKKRVSKWQSQRQGMVGYLRIS